MNRIEEYRIGILKEYIRLNPNFKPHHQQGQGLIKGVRKLKLPKIIEKIKLKNGFIQ